jgi:hypothetical protein
MPVRFRMLKTQSARHNHDGKNRTGKSACATKPKTKPQGSAGNPATALGFIVSTLECPALGYGKS